MSDLNTAFINDDLSGGFMVNPVTDVDNADQITSAKAVGGNNLNKDDFMMTTYSAIEANVFNEDIVQECVWESCFVVPLDSLNSSALNKELLVEENLLCQDVFGHGMKLRNHVKQKNSTKIKTRRKANSKQQKSNLSAVEKTNLDDRHDLCSVVDAVDDNFCSRSSEVTSTDVVDCLEDGADHVTDLATGFECTEEELAGGSNGDDVSLFHSVPLPTSVHQEHLLGLPGISSYPENSGENRNTLNNNVMLQDDCQEKVEIMQSNTAVISCEDFSDLAPGSGNVVQCVTNDSAEAAVSSMLNKRKKKEAVKKSKRVKRELSTNLEEPSEELVCSESDALSTIGEPDRCAGNTAVPDANAAEHEDPSTGFVSEAPDVDAACSVSDVVPDVQTSSQSLLQDDVDDIAEFPAFPRERSRRLRRTSIIMYRRSLQDAEDAALQEEKCDTWENMEECGTAAAADAETTATTNDVTFDDYELVLLPTKSYQSLTLPTTAVDNANMPSDVETVELSSITESQGTDISDETDSSLMNITNSRPRRRRSTVNSQASAIVSVALQPKKRQRKPSTSCIEDIYLNRLWRSQMPKEKALESIPETSMLEQLGSCKVMKRVRSLKFEDGPNKTKLRQRHQKATKNGWKPITKKQDALLDRQLSSKLAELESDLNSVTE